MKLTTSQLAAMFVGTIHAFCLDLLMTEVHELLKFNVLNEVQQTLFIDRHSKTSGLTTCTDLKGGNLRRYLDTARYLSALNIMREDEADHTALGTTPLPAALDQYQALLDAKRYLDYSEILARAVEELTNNATLRAHLADRIKHVIVDEYQDVNTIQEAIVWLLHELGNQLFQRPSDFLTDVHASRFVKRRPPDYSARPKLPPEQRQGVANVVFSFSDLMPSATANSPATMPTSSKSTNSTTGNANPVRWTRNSSKRCAPRSATPPPPYAVAA